MAWNAALPANNSKLKDTPAYIRANWAAIATGTDPALLITNDKISPTAGIVDTKLAQIATASKVHGTSITGLASVPSGAGQLPVANVPDLAASKITTGQLAIARGGTNLSSAGATANRVMVTVDGSVFSMDLVSLTSMVTGTLPRAQGGLASTAANNAANGVVFLDASSKLPAVDGSLLTGIANSISKVIPYTGNGSDNRTVAHGLGVAPNLVIITNVGTTGRASILWVYGMSAGYSQDLSDSNFNNTSIKSVDATNITLGTNGFVNGNGINYMAFVLKTSN